MTRSPFPDYSQLFWRREGSAYIMEVQVEGSLERAIKILKKKMASEGVFKEMKLRSFYEKPSVKRKRKREEAERKRRKAMRRAQRSRH